MKIADIVIAVFNWLFLNVFIEGIYMCTDTLPPEKMLGKDY